MTNDWTIQSRSHACAATGRTFNEGEYFYTLLFMENGVFRREDLSEEAFKARNENVQPFSHWRAKYVPPPPPQQETVSKQTAEDLLRQYMDEGSEEHGNARYILALMLERKRILKEVEVKRNDDGSLLRVYEHTKTGEVFIIPDPQLRLDQVAAVQAQVAGYLGGTPPPPPQPPTPPTSPTSEPAPLEAGPSPDESSPAPASGPAGESLGDGGELAEIPETAPSPEEEAPGGA